jgi:sphingomyelin phosphodiesterase 2
MVHHGDWIVAKAAGCATIDVPDLGLLDVWVTHVSVDDGGESGTATGINIVALPQTVAAGGEGGPESRRAHRITQAYELAKFARISAERGHHVICVSAAVLCRVPFGSFY